MFTPKAHIIVIDGPQNVGKKMFTFELSLALLYSAQRTAIVLSPDSPLYQTIQKRHILLPQLLSPAIIKRENFYTDANKFNAVIIPDISTADELAETASTYITMIPYNPKSAQNFTKNTQYINNVWELKKKIAATYGHSLNWIVCENNLNNKAIKQPTQELKETARTYGFRIAPPLNHRMAYKNNINGISAQDKTLPMLNKSLTYEDICTKREMTKLAEFIFNA